MRKQMSLAITGLLLIGSSCLLAAEAQESQVAAAGMGRERLCFNNDWRFALGRVDDLESGTCAGAYLLKAGDGFRAKNFTNHSTMVRLPHDWGVGLKPDPGAFKKNAFTPLGPKFPDTSIGWYWRSFTLPESDQGRRIWVEFDGIFRNAMVWVNGHYLGTHEPGYESFRYDISDIVEPGRNNDMVVRVDATLHEGWWYEGAGIYRSVWLTKTDPVAIAPDGVFVHPDFPGNDPSKVPQVNIAVNVQNLTRLETLVTLENEILDSKGNKVGVANGSATIPAGECVNIKSSATVPSPQLWSHESPTLYTLVTRVSAGKRVTDEIRTPFGFRTVAFDPAQGFLLNGKRLMLKGVCLHHDFPAVGTAMTPSLHKYRLQVIRSYGANAIRMSHNQPDPVLLDLCDRMGFLVMDEVRPFGSTEYAQQQLRNLVMRDRNHPSIVLWSLGNEEPVQNNPAGGRMGQTAVDLVHKLDPTRPVTHGNNHSEKTNGVNAVVDVHGWNYGSIDNGWIPYHEKYPTVPTLITELNANNPTYGDPTKKEFRLPYNRVSFWKKIEANPWMSGVFFWTGFDYAGEVVGKNTFPYRHSDFGIVDRCGFRKEIAWRWQALWSDAPLVHLSDEWKGTNGVMVKVPVVCNVEEVELLLNGRSISRLRPDPKDPQETVSFAVPYEEGRLEAKGYRGGVVVAADKVETTGPVAGIMLEAPRLTVPADWNETILVNAFLVDSKGRKVISGNQNITFVVEGPATLLGVGNGDPSGAASELAASIPAYKGRAQAVIAATPVAGDVIIVARCEGMPEQKLIIKTTSAPLIAEVPVSGLSPKAK